MANSQLPIKKLLLNCDMGESLGPWSMGMDEQVMPLVDMANIACGFHASDPITMTRTVLLAKHSNTQIGAHPSYPDLIGFGRRSMQCTPLEIIAMVQYQIGALDGICRAHDSRVSYVKPHGALYNDMMRDADILRAVLQAVASYDNSLPLMLLAATDNSKTQSIAAEFGITLLFEAFADRAYDDSGFLLPRTEKGSVYHSEQQILQQALLLATEGSVINQGGHKLKLDADTLCVHGDNADSVQAIQHIRNALNTLYRCL
ncbi:5-oxoprolinase subunit PxpA [Methylophaga sp.]|uniref:5-oxoprolinase subunit PxpA n=1 Tax=Methylophaga sp. TaxID=2024840 RepID=UPI002718C017|nr:5-oxoprolinase subunit PxpA [Methylophaga sp.]MDO8826132.1 5-oxoprolinase subunit PxpA [Methylophaga sp.]